MSSMRERAIADADRLLNTDDFAQRGTFTPVGGSAKVINVNLIAAWQASDAFDSQAENADAVAMVKSSDVSGAKPNSLLTVGAVTYYLLSPPMDNGYGMAQLALSRDEVG